MLIFQIWRLREKWCDVLLTFDSRRFILVHDSFFLKNGTISILPNVHLLSFYEARKTTNEQLSRKFHFLSEQQFEMLKRNAL